MMRNRQTIKYFLGYVFFLAGVLVAQGPPQLPPLINEDAPKAIPGPYIVVFKSGAARAASATGSAVTTSVQDQPVSVVIPEQGCCMNSTPVSA